MEGWSKKCVEPTRPKVGQKANGTATYSHPPSPIITPQPRMSIWTPNRAMLTDTRKVTKP